MKLSLEIIRSYGFKERTHKPLAQDCQVSRIVCIFTYNLKTMDEITQLKNRISILQLGPNQAILNRLLLRLAELNLKQQLKKHTK